MKKKPDVVGRLDQQVVNTFNLPYKVGQEIYCGESNLDHMRNNHPQDFEKYHMEIENIIANPDYIAKHPKKSSVEYVKVFKDNNGEHVLVAVRATGKGQLFARTLFVMDTEKVDKYTDKGAFIEYK